MKKLLCLFFSVLFSFMVFAQVGVNPEDEFYSDALSWYLKGYVEKLPQLKPYPQNIIQEILDTVKECEDEKVSERAEYYIHKIYDRKVHGGFDFNGDMRLKASENALPQVDKEKTIDTKLLLTSEIFCSGDWSFNEKLGASWELGVLGYNNDVLLSQVHPKYIYDSNQQKIDVLSWNAGIVDFLLDTNANVTYGTKNLYGNFGFNKTGYGLYPDTDLILNPTSYQAFNSSINYVGKYFEYTHYMGLLGSRSTVNQNSYLFNKLIAFHSIKFPLLNRKISISYFEATVGSTPFMAAYVMPVPFVIMGNISAFKENILAGLNFEYKPLNCIALTADFLFDDLKPKEFIKFNWNEAAIRSAIRFGFAYSPFDSICKLITFDYTLVTPYTYTSYDSSNSEYNGYDFTNCGIGIGSDLPPNSDRILVKIQFHPYKRLNVSTFTSFVRHSNAYLSLYNMDSGEYQGGDDNPNIPENAFSDGGINMTTQGIPLAEEYTNFLTQITTMYTIQAGVSLDYQFYKTRTGGLTCGLGYKFEYIRQDGLDTDIFSSAITTAEQGYSQAIYWYTNCLKNSVNNYLSLTFTYVF